MRIISWNINSVRLREPLLLRLLKAQKPDIVCLQETKCPNDAFPEKAMRRLGFTHIIKNGIKGYHGVAVLSRLPIVDFEMVRYCRKSDGRHIEAVVSHNRKRLHIHNFYVPAGGDEPDVKINEKFAHKLSFLREMKRRLTAQGSISAQGSGMAQSGGTAAKRAVLVGDLNIAPYEHDVWSSAQLKNVVSHTPIERKYLEQVRQSRDWLDVARHFVPMDEKLYSWWSYRAKEWATSNRGRRLDHIWVTPALTPHVQAFKILRAARGWTRPSDHVPICLDVDI